MRIALIKKFLAGFISYGYPEGNNSDHFQHFRPTWEDVVSDLKKEGHEIESAILLDFQESEKGTSILEDFVFDGPGLRVGIEDCKYLGLDGKTYLLPYVWNHALAWKHLPMMCMGVGVNTYVRFARQIPGMRVGKIKNDRIVWENDQAEEALKDRYIAAARRVWGSMPDHDFEIDEFPEVSIGVDGAWIQAWVFVSSEEVKN